MMAFLPAGVGGAIGVILRWWHRRRCYFCRTAPKPVIEPCTEHGDCRGVQRIPGLAVHLRGEYRWP